MPNLTPSLWLMVIQMPNSKEFYVIFFILTREQIIVFNKYSTYSKPIPQISQGGLHEHEC